MGGLSDVETNSEYYSYLAKRHKKIILEPKKARVKIVLILPTPEESSCTNRNFRLRLNHYHRRLGKKVVR